VAFVKHNLGAWRSIGRFILASCLRCSPFGSAGPCGRDRGDHRWIRCWRSRWSHARPEPAHFL